MRTAQGEREAAEQQAKADAALYGTAWGFAAYQQPEGVQPLDGIQDLTPLTGSSHALAS